MKSEQAVHGPGILELVNKTVKLPTIPTVLLKLNEVVNDPDSSAEDVAKVISCDPSITTNILRIVNSAYYGLQVRVSSINLAVSIMGFNMTKKVALKAAIFSVFGKKKEAVAHFDPELFWTHSIFCGVAAKVLAGESPYFSGIHPEDIYIAGLLHDIGKIILFENAPGPFLQALDAAAHQGIPTSAAEEEVLGFTHSDVGSVLAIKWFLPEDLTIAVRYHHNPAKDPFSKSLASLVHLADWLAWKEGRVSAPKVLPPTLEESVFEKVGLEQDQMEDLAEKVRQEFSKVGDSF